MDLKHFVSRPSEHLKNYPILLEAAHKETDPENPDADFLVAAAQAIRNLSTVAQLRTFQTGMARSRNGPSEWHQLVGADVVAATDKTERQKQGWVLEGVPDVPVNLMQRPAGLFSKSYMARWSSFAISKPLNRYVLPIDSRVPPHHLHSYMSGLC